MDENSNKKRYFLIYTVTFGITALLVFSWFILSGKTLVWNDDGWTQHYTAMVYYSRFLRSIAKSLIFEHKLVIPEWEFALGEIGRAHV